VSYLAAVAARGVTFEAESTEGVAEARTAARSQVDDRLADLLAFFLRDRRYTALIGEAKQRELEVLLAESRSASRDALIHQTWAGLADWLREQQPLGLDLSLKRTILATMERGGSGGSAALPQSRRGQLIAEIAAEIAARPEPAYTMLTARGSRQRTDTLAARSADAPGGAWHIDRTGRVVLVSTYTVNFGEVAMVWRYPFTAKGKLGTPVRTDYMWRSARPHRITPAL
jgi:hypothetical protein